MKNTFFILFSFLLLFSTKAQSLQFLLDFTEKIKVDTVWDGERHIFNDYYSVSPKELIELDKKITNYLKKEEKIRKRYIQIIEKPSQLIYKADQKKLDDLLKSNDDLEKLKQDLLNWKYQSKLNYSLVIEQHKKEKLNTLFKDLHHFKNELLPSYIQNKDILNDIIFIMKIDDFFESLPSNFELLQKS